MLVAALHKDLYLAYDTQRGKLYKAWKGIVNFEGAVYDGAHGPQPGSVGDAYYLDDTDVNTWYPVKNGEVTGLNFDYKGHRFSEASLVLDYSLESESAEVRFSEKAEYKISESGQLQLVRDFTLDETELLDVLQLKTEAVLVDKSQLITNCEFDIISEEPLSFDSRSFIKYKLNFKLKPGQQASITIPLLETVYLDPNIEDGFEGDSKSLPRGAQLIGKNDCKTCHNVSKQTVGPSYKAIAQKYEHNDDNMLMLVSKISEGGSGIWGEQVMTPHPEISTADLRDMVSYIFTLAEFEGESSIDESIEKFDAAMIDEQDLIPGAVTHVYTIERSANKIPEGLQKRTPTQAGIMAAFDNINGGDFKSLEDHFALSAKGILKIETAGEYGFRVWSDDGSKLYLHDKLVIDNDGLHGTEMKQTSLYLEEGYHPFLLEFFQGSGGKFLSFNLKNPGEDKWKVVPREMISHLKEDQAFVSEMSLPMSVVTKIPGDGMAVESVHPSFDLFQARPDDFQKKIGGIDFLEDGRLIVSVWEKEGAVYIIDNHKSEDPSKIKYKKIAEGLAEPLGLKVVGDRIFVMQKQEITELLDNNNDDIIDEYISFCNDWGVTSNFHEFGFGLEEMDGHLYANLATGILPGGAGMPNQHPDRGSCIKVSLEDGSMEILANGLRTPNGVGLGYRNELFVSDNQGDWLPSSKILHVQKGDWFGSRAVDFEGTAERIEKKPVVWLPQDEIGNSPSTPLWLNLGPYKDQMIHGEVTHGGVKRVFVEEIEGQLQGCVFRFIQGLEAGVNRMRWSPDGDLYVGGIGNPGNWQHTGKKWYGLQRLSFNGNSAFEMLAIRAQSDGVEIEFTEALKSGDGWNASDYEIRQWYYEPTAEYGGPKLDDRILDIQSVNVSKDRKKVFLELEGMKEDHVIYVRLKEHFVSENENSLWSTESWYTMNRIPAEKKGFRTTPPQENALNTLSETEKAEGWELLFDGQTIDKFKTFNKDSLGACWYIDDSAIHFDPSRTGRGDIITREEYENYEFKIEWRISNCGNSGIMFNVVEDEKYCCPYMTGPEMQVLDNTCHPDSKYRTHRAGDLYDMIESKIETVKPAGEWNKVRIKSLNGELEFWLNGYKIVEFTMHNDEWTERIANSKFKEWEDFGTARSGHIALQDHDDKVWFRNIKIRKL